MNGIVRVTDNPANVIDALRSNLAKQARHLSGRAPSLASALLGHLSQKRCRSRVDAYHA